MSTSCRSTVIPQPLRCFDCHCPPKHPSPGTSMPCAPHLSLFRASRDPETSLCLGPCCRTGLCMFASSEAAAQAAAAWQGQCALGPDVMAEVVLQQRAPQAQQAPPRANPPPRRKVVPKPAVVVSCPSLCFEPTLGYPRDIPGSIHWGSLSSKPWHPAHMPPPSGEGSLGASAGQLPLRLSDLLSRHMQVRGLSPATSSDRLVEVFSEAGACSFQPAALLTNLRWPALARNPATLHPMLRCAACFAPAGPIKRLRLVVDEEGRSAGVAFITFMSPEAMQAALMLGADQLVIDGHRPTVSPAHRDLAPAEQQQQQVAPEQGPQGQQQQGDLQQHGQPAHVQMQAQTRGRPAWQQAAGEPARPWRGDPAAGASFLLSPAGVYGPAPPSGEVSSDTLFARPLG